MAASRTDYARRHGATKRWRASRCTPVRARPRICCRRSTKNHVRAIIDRSLQRLRTWTGPISSSSTGGITRSGWRRRPRSWLGRTPARRQDRSAWRHRISTPTMSQRFAAAGVPMAAMQVQYSLLDHRPEQGFIDACRRHGHPASLLRLRGRRVPRRSGWVRRSLRGSSRTGRLTKHEAHITDDFGGWPLFQLTSRRCGRSRRARCRHRNRWPAAMCWSGRRWRR